MTTKRYILFAGAAYYPEGGAHEFRGFGTVEELKKLYEKNRFAWAKEFNCRSPWGHICDHETMQIVSEATATKEGILWMDAPTPPAPPDHHNARSIADNLRRQIQKTPPWARPLAGLLTALVVSVLSPAILLWFIGMIAWDVTFGD